MKLLTMMLLLVAHLSAETCWNTDTNEWVEFTWLNDQSFASYNAIDLELNKLEVYEYTTKRYACTYIKD
jgi:hypothetical protein